MWFLQVVNVVTRKRVGPDEIGELCIKHDYLMAGYVNNPDETKAFFDCEGFAKSGDVVRFDKSGKIFFISRCKDLMK